MRAIQYEHIAVIQHDVGNGITEPKYATTDNGKLLVVKTYNGPEGKRVLFNELFCYRLAKLLNVTMPSSGICLIDRDTIIYNEGVTDKQFGFGFYSTFIHKAVPLVDEIIPLISNKEEFYRVILFDHIVFNSDRNPGNMLVQYYKSDIRLHMIDHSHVFVNQAIWDSQCLIRAMEEKDYTSERIVRDNDFLYRMFYHHLPMRIEHLLDLRDVFMKTVTRNNIQNILEDIPNEWLPSPTDIDTLTEYILYRIEHFDDLCDTIQCFLKK